MFQSGLRVTDIAHYYNCHPSTIQGSLPDYWDSKRSTPAWSTKNCNTSSRRYCNIDSVLRPEAVSSLRQSRRRTNSIDQHNNASALTASLTVNSQAANIILWLDRPPLSQDMSAIEPLIATLKSKGITI